MTTILIRRWQTSWYQVKADSKQSILKFLDLRSELNKVLENLHMQLALRWDISFQQIPKVLGSTVMFGTSSFIIQMSLQGLDLDYAQIECWDTFRHEISSWELFLNEKGQIENLETY